ncbi:MAG: cyclic pyranopterin monophosphate synthase MoaC [bacterium]
MVDISKKIVTERVAVADLTIYDMCKSVDKEMIISDIKLLRENGGKGGNYVRKEKNNR